MKWDRSTHGSFRGCVLVPVPVRRRHGGGSSRREFWLTPPKLESDESYMVPPPPFTEGIFPCSECHKEMTPNPTRRELKDEHTNIVLNHAAGSSGGASIATT